MKITKIEPQTKNPERANIFADGKFFCGLDIDVMYSLNIKEGCDITEELEKTFKEANQKSKCMRKALSLLNYRDRTTYELRKKLKKSLFDKNEIDYTVEKLENNHYIDNDNFLSTYISFYKDTVSKTKIIQKLWQLGVPNDVILSKLEMYYNETDEYASCLAAMNAKIRFAPMEKAKLIRHLLYKGYKYSVVSQVLQEHFSENKD